MSHQIEVRFLAGHPLKYYGDLIMKLIDDLNVNDYWDIVVYGDEDGSEDRLMRNAFMVMVGIFRIDCPELAAFMLDMRERIINHVKSRENV